MLSTYVIISLASLVVGGLSGAFITHRITKEEPDPDPIVDVTSEAQQEVILQLTDIDLLKEPCSSAFIEEKGDLLCREMFCLIMTRGIDAQTSGTQCEQIANIANTKIIRDDCRMSIDGEEECYRLYRERK